MLGVVREKVHPIQLVNAGFICFRTEIVLAETGEDLAGGGEGLMLVWRM